MRRTITALAGATAALLLAAAAAAQTETVQQGGSPAAEIEGVSTDSVIVSVLEQTAAPR